MTDWSSWLADPARTGTSPPEVIVDAVRRACGGAAPASIERLLHGESNEVYDVHDANGRRVIVRIGRRSPSLFPGERWAIDAARRAGTPVPEVLLVDTVADDLAVCVESHAGGEPLIQRAGSLSSAAWRSAVVDAGRALAHIHSVPVAGWGFPVDAEGRGPDEDGSGFLAGPARSPEWYRPGAEEAGYDLDRFDRALAVLEQASSTYAGPPRLVHADFGAKHVLVDDAGDVTAIIDFETARGGDPAYDVAAWDIYFRDSLRTSWLLEGYAEVTPVDDDLLRRVDLHLVLVAVRLLGHSQGPNGFKGFVPLATSTIDAALERLSDRP